MMILITGGAFQGKTAFAKERFSLREEDFADGGSCLFAELGSRPALKCLHLLVRRMLKAGCSEQEIETSVLRRLAEGDCKIVLTDEIGCGVSPMEKEERIWRECAGRLGCRLAKLSDAVVVLQCGLPTVLKGKLPEKEDL